MNNSKLKLVVNTNNSLINSLEKVHAVDSVLAKEIIKEVYDLAKLNQRELAAKEINQFGTQTLKLLEKLAQKVIG